MHINCILFLLVLLFIIKWSVISRQALKYVVPLWHICTAFFYWRQIYLILLSSDVESNPGPSTFKDGFFTFSHTNVNSLVAHDFIRVSQLEAFGCQYNLDIIAISETALTPNIASNKLDIEGYTLIRRDLPINTTHGGVCIYHKSNLAVKSRADLEKHPNILVMEVMICKK